MAFRTNAAMIAATILAVAAALFYAPSLTATAQAEESLTELARDVANFREKLDKAKKELRAADKDAAKASSSLEETETSLKVAEQELTTAKRSGRRANSAAQTAATTEQDTAKLAAATRSEMVQLIREAYVHGSANAELVAFVDFAAQGPQVLNVLASHNVASQRIETSVLNRVADTADDAQSAASKADGARNKMVSAAVRLDRAQDDIRRLKDQRESNIKVARRTGRENKAATAKYEQIEQRFTKAQETFRNRLDSSGGSIGEIGSRPDSPAGNKAQLVWDILIAEGFSPEAAAGILGNLQQESNIDPTLLQSGGPGTGLAQWSRGGRWDNGPNSLLAFAGSRGLDPWSAVTQTRFMIYEMESVIGSFDLPRFKKSKDIIESTVYFHDIYERSADSSAFVSEVRGSYALNWYQALAGKEGSSR